MLLRALLGLLAVAVGAVGQDRQAPAARCPATTQVQLVRSFVPAEDRSTIGAYIRRRHRHHDHLTLVRFGSKNEQGGIDLTLLLRRRADDYRPRNLIPAKQDSICASGRASLIVWSM
jgi:hypothetical protein